MTHRPRPAAAATRRRVARRRAAGGRGPGHGRSGWSWSLVWHDAPFSLTFDDAFYYFGIARNVAHGHGSTFDGIDLTNGYHPLWMLMASPVYRLGLRRHRGGAGAAGVPGAVLRRRAGAGGLDGRAGHRRLAAAARPTARRRPTGPPRWCTAMVAVALVAVAANPFMVKVFVNGMESGVLVLLDAALLAVGRRVARAVPGTGSARRRLGIGAAAGPDRAGPHRLGAAGGRAGAVGPGRGPDRLGRRAVAAAGRAVRPARAWSWSPTWSRTRCWFGLWRADQRADQAGAAHAPSRRRHAGAGRRWWPRRVGAWGLPPQPRHARRRPRFGRVGGLHRLDRVVRRLLRAGGGLLPGAAVPAVALVLLPGRASTSCSCWCWRWPTSPRRRVLEAPADRAARPGRCCRSAPSCCCRWWRAFALRGAARSPIPHALLDRHRRPRRRPVDRRPTCRADAVLASWDAGVVGYYANRPVINLDGVANSYAYYQAGRNGTSRAVPGRRHVVGHRQPGHAVDGEDPGRGAVRARRRSGRARRAGCR